MPRPGDPRGGSRPPRCRGGEPAVRADRRAGRQPRRVVREEQAGESSPRVLTPTFSKIALRWSWTVQGEMWRRRAIAFVLSPRATSCVTARSRSVSDQAPAARLRHPRRRAPPRPVRRRHPRRGRRRRGTHRRRRGLGRRGAHHRGRAVGLQAAGAATAAGRLTGPAARALRPGSPARRESRYSCSGSAAPATRGEGHDRSGHKRPAAGREPAGRLDRGGAARRAASCSATSSSRCPTARPARARRGSATSASGSSGRNPDVVVGRGDRVADRHPAPRLRDAGVRDPRRASTTLHWDTWPRIDDAIASYAVVPRAARRGRDPGAGCASRSGCRSRRAR